MNFIKELINKEHFNATEVDYLNDNRLHKEILYCLVKIDKTLKLVNKTKAGRYSFIITDVNSKLFKAIDFVTNRLKKDGFKFEFGKNEYTNQKYPRKATIRFTIIDGLNNEYLFYERLIKIIDFYKSQIIELKRPTKTIKEIAYTDIIVFLKIFKELIVDEKPYLTRTW